MDQRRFEINEEVTVTDGYLTVTGRIATISIGETSQSITLKDTDPGWNQAIFHVGEKYRWTVVESEKDTDPEEGEAPAVAAPSSKEPWFVTTDPKLGFVLEHDHGDIDMTWSSNSVAAANNEADRRNAIIRGDTVILDTEGNWMPGSASISQEQAIVMAASLLPGISYTDVAEMVEFVEERDGMADKIAKILNDSGHDVVPGGPVMDLIMELVYS